MRLPLFSISLAVSLVLGVRPCAAADPFDQLFRPNPIRPTSFTLGPSLRKSACAQAIVQLSREVLEQLGSTEGTFYIDRIADMARTLKNVQVPKVQAENIAQEFFAFVNGEHTEPALRSIRDYWKVHHQEIPGVVIPPEDRVLLGVFSSKTSQFHLRQNLSVFPAPGQVVMLAPAPYPDEPARVWVSSLLGTLAHSEGLYFIHQWAQAVWAYRDAGIIPDEWAPHVVDKSLAPKCVTGDFYQVFGRLRADWISDQVSAHWLNDRQEASALRMVQAQQNFRDLDGLNAQAKQLRIEWGIHEPKDYYPRIDKMMRAMDATVMRYRAPLN